MVAAFMSCQLRHHKRTLRQIHWRSLFMASLVGVCSIGRSAEPFTITKIEADGIGLQIPDSSPSAVEVRAHTRMLDIDFSEQSAPATQPLRYRYQLEGADREWRDPIGLMRFTVRFNDAKDNTISGEEFDAHGESSGWTGDVQTSRFTARRELLEIPAGAERLQIWMSSAGPQQTMGLYAFADLSITLVPRDAQQTSQRISLIPVEGSLMQTSAGTPAGWARHGTSLSIAQIAPREGRPPMIIMRDDRPDAFGGWLTTSLQHLALNSFSRIVIEWKEAYSIGWGGSSRISYPYLPVGDYRMRVQPHTVDGKPVGAETSTRITIVPPFHETKLFAFLIATSAAATISLIVRQITRNRMQRRLDALERERAVEHERSRIARDLHDLLGADLTHLALLSDLAQNDLKDPRQTAEQLDQIFDLARGLTRQVDEIVWAVNPANDSIAGFVPFLCNHAQSYLLAANTPCRIDVPASLPQMPLSSTHRHHLFLSVKEALHNTVKHSKATEVWLHIRFDDHTMQIQIEDNGRGIAPDHIPGDGLRNMQQRMAELGGNMNVKPNPGTGTTLTFNLPLNTPS
jgi:signal transduction histidine kinase